MANRYINNGIVQSVITYKILFKTKKKIMSSNALSSSTLLSWRLMLPTVISDVDLLLLNESCFGSWCDPLKILSCFPTSTSFYSFSRPSSSNNSVPPAPSSPLSAKLPFRACCGISHFLCDMTSSVVALR